jgi:hypothetical protein
LATTFKERSVELNNYSKGSQSGGHIYRENIDVKAFKVRYLTMLSVAKKVKRLCQEK